MEESYYHYAIQLTKNYQTKYFSGFDENGNLNYGDLVLPHEKIKYIEKAKILLEEIQEYFPQLKPRIVKITETVEVCND